MGRGRRGAGSTAGGALPEAEAVPLRVTEAGEASRRPHGDRSELDDPTVRDEPRQALLKARFVEVEDEERLAVDELARGQEPAGDRRLRDGGRVETQVGSSRPGGARRGPTERLAEEAGGALQIARRDLEMTDRQPHRGPNLSHAGPGADVALPGGFSIATDPATGLASWSPATLGELVAHLAGPGATGLAAIPDDALLAAWSETVERFRDPEGDERQALAEGLAARTGLSPRGLAAALETMLAGVARQPAARLLARAAPLVAPSPALVVLAGNLPALGLQPLLPALALRRPVLLKSPTAEPLFLPAFVRTLAARLPALGDGIAVACWRGGDAALEAPVLAAVGRVLAYGDAPALADLERRAPGKVIGHGPKASLALVGVDADLAAAAAGLARDVALFDQRGCLSVHAVYCAAPAEELAARLADALRRLAAELPPGAPSLAASAAVRQLREEAALRGLAMPPLDFALGTVVVEPRPDFRPSPGMRTVRVHPVGGLSAAVAALAPWRELLQGVSLAGAEAWAQRDGLTALGVSRVAAPGELQSVDAAWANGGIDPLVALS